MNQQIKESLEHSMNKKIKWIPLTFNESTSKWITLTFNESTNKWITLTFNESTNKWINLMNQQVN